LIRFKRRAPSRIDRGDGGVVDCPPYARHTRGMADLDISAPVVPRDRRLEDDYA
jgi:hypothetical protein